MSDASPILTSLQSFIQGGLQRCLASTSKNSNPTAAGSTFHAYIHNPVQQGACHTALELEEVLLQVFKYLDSRTLCTTIPLVCQLWRAAVESQQLWTPRCDPQLLAVLRLPTDRTSDSPAATTAATAAHAVDSTGGSNPAVTASTPSTGRRQYRVRLPLLHHAVYSSNLLRNPLFCSALNGSYSSTLQRLRATSSSTKPAVLTPDQRKLAWVTTVGSPTWQVVQAAAAAATGGGQPLLPLRYPRAPTTSTRLPSQLQGWLFGKPAAPAAVPALAAAAAQQAAGFGSSPSAGGSMQAGPSAPAQAAAAAVGGGVSCLATGSNWGEVVQVVDLLGELVARGLDATTAVAVLDSGTLSVALSFWVAAEPDSSTSSTSTSSSSADNARADPQPPPPAATAHGGVRPGSARWPPAQFAAALMLDAGQEPLQRFQTFVLTDSSHHFFSRRLALEPADGWRRYAYVVPCCPRGSRRAVVLLRGRGTGPGLECGVRFACAQLCFMRRDEVLGFGAEACLADWQDRVVQGL